MDSRYQRQRARRRRVRIVRLLAGGVVACVLAAGALLWMATGMQHRPRVADSASGATRLAYKASVATTPVPMGSLTPSRTAETSATSHPASQTPPGAQSAHDTGHALEVIKKASVRFPDAPSISGSTKSISQLRPRHKYIALTLDDGYDFQPEMLEFLKAHNVRCTTFLVGNWASDHTREVKRMRDAGFEIANHSWSHPFLTRLSSAGVRRELTRTQKVITRVTGDQAPYLRPPFGDTDADVKATAADLGYRIVLWNRSFGDSGRGATPKKLYKNVMKSNGGVKPGDIILGHWSSKPTYEALKKIVPELQAQGYEFVTVSELIADSKR